MKAIEILSRWLRRSRRIRPRRQVWAAVSVLLLVLAGCGTTRVAEKEEEFLWPLPPEPPRIKFVRSIHSEMDVGKRRGFAEDVSEALFGRKRMWALRKPYAVSVNPQGKKVYVADSGWKKLWVFDFPGRRMYALGEGGKGGLSDPRGVAVDNAGRIYATDMEEKRVVVFDKAGNYLSAMGGKDILVRPTGITVDEERGRIYVADTWDHQIKAFSLEGKLLFSIGHKGERPQEEVAAIQAGRQDHFWNRGDKDAQFRFPTHVALDPEGNLYVVDTMNFRVQVFDPEGRFLKKLGRLGDNPGEFVRPKGIGLDSEGHIYVADAAFNNVQIFDQEGRLLLAFGVFGYGKADLRLPAGIHIDAQDRVYVVDQYNHRIQVYQYLSQMKGQETSANITSGEGG